MAIFSVYDITDNFWCWTKKESHKDIVVISDILTKEMKDSCEAVYCHANVRIKIEAKNEIIIMIFRGGLLAREISIGSDMEICGGYATILIKFDPIAPFSSDWI